MRSESRDWGAEAAVTPRTNVHTVANVRELFGEKSEPPAQPPDNRRLVIEVFLLLATLVTALANFFGQATGWFRWITAVLAIVVIGWVASQLITWGRTLLAGYRERATLAGAVRLLHNEFADLVTRFSRYADNTVMKGKNAIEELKEGHAQHRTGREAHMDGHGGDGAWHRRTLLVMRPLLFDPTPSRFNRIGHS